MTFHRILVPTDFSPAADKAVALAVELARRDKGAITLFHVTPYPAPLITDYGPLPIADFQPNLEEIGKQCRALLEREAGKAVPTDVPWTPKVVLGMPADEITTELQTGAYDVVVMGTHGRTGVSHLLLGSVAERVLRHATIPVLVTR